MGLEGWLKPAPTKMTARPLINLTAKAMAKGIKHARRIMF
jgi:hypothetical protein